MLRNFCLKVGFCSENKNFQNRIFFLIAMWVIIIGAWYKQYKSMAPDSRYSAPPSYLIRQRLRGEGG